MLYQSTHWHWHWHGEPEDQWSLVVTGAVVGRTDNCCYECHWRSQLIQDNAESYPSLVFFVLSSWSFLRWLQNSRYPQSVPGGSKTDKTQLIDYRVRILYLNKFFKKSWIVAGSFPYKWGNLDIKNLTGLLRNCICPVGVFFSYCWHDFIWLALYLSCSLDCYWKQYAICRVISSWTSEHSGGRDKLR